MAFFSKHSGRRAFLQGAGGACLALPLLEFTHGHAWAGGDVGKRRFITIFSHGGTISNMERDSFHSGTSSHHGEDWWRPADPTSEVLVPGPIHEVVAEHAAKLLLLGGIDNKAVIAQRGRGRHRFSNVSALTAADMTGEEEQDASSAGPSIDQVVAERLTARDMTPIDRIHLGVGGNPGYKTPYYTAPHQSSSSFQSPTEAFDAYFAGVTGDEGPTLAEIREAKTRMSVLDGLLESYDTMIGEVSASDRMRIEAHLEQLRALEYELDNPVVCSPPEVDASGGAGNIVGPQQVELIIAALRCGVTNVANLEINDLLTPWTDVGTPLNLDRGHTLGHRGRDIGPTGAYPGQYDTWFAETLANRRWRMTLLNQLLDGLDDPTFLEGGNTLLDNAVVLYTSEFSNPGRHSSHNLPVLLAGSGGGYFQTGRYVDYNVHAGPDPSEYSSPESTHNLYTSILHAMGEADEHFGNGDAEHEGPLPGLT